MFPVSRKPYFGIIPVESRGAPGMSTNSPGCDCKRYMMLNYCTLWKAWNGRLTLPCLTGQCCEVSEDKQTVLDKEVYWIARSMNTSVQSTQGWLPEIYRKRWRQCSGVNPATSWLWRLTYININIESLVPKEFIEKILWNISKYYVICFKSQITNYKLCRTYIKGFLNLFLLRHLPKGPE